MSDHPDLNPWRGPESWDKPEPTNIRLESRIAALEEKLDALVSDYEEAFEKLQDLNLVHMRDQIVNFDVRIKILENLDAQADSDEFAHFWDKYPRKVGKATARKAFVKACKKVSFDQIMDGLAKYQREKPDKIDWKHPATWLNSEGWEDNWTDRPQDAPGEPEASTEGKDTSRAIRALWARYASVDGLPQATEVRSAFCAKRDRDLHILAACSDSIPEVKRFMPMLGDKPDFEVIKQQRTIRTQLDAISMDLGYGPIQWPRAS